MSEADPKPMMASRFRGFLPVVVDVETGGFNAQTDALLEIAAVTVKMDKHGYLHSDESVHAHVEPFPGANLEPEALAFTGIDPHHPFRLAKSEHDALQRIFQTVRSAVKRNDCSRAILVGHNAFFDLGFVNAAVERTGIKRNPFHPFSTGKQYWRGRYRPRAWAGTVTRPIRRSTTPNAPRSYSAPSSTAGRGCWNWAKARPIRGPRPTPCNAKAPQPGPGCGAPVARWRAAPDQDAWALAAAWLAIFCSSPF
jgi:ribonuclease T